MIAALGLFGAVIVAPIAAAFARAADVGFDWVQGCLGPRLADLLADVKRFMQTGAREVVILKFSHYLDVDSASDLKDGVFAFDEAQTTMLVSAVVAALGEYLYTAPLPGPGASDPRGGRLANTPLSTLLGSRGVVLPVFDLDGSVFKPQPGTYSYSDFQPLPAVVIQGPNPDPGRAAQERDQLQRANLLVYDQYANKSDLQQLSSDQLAKLRTVPNHDGDLFLFSWTLTLSDTASLRCDDATGTLSLATTADNALAATVTAEYARGGITQSTLPNVLFVDRASDFATDVAVWLDQRMSLGDTLVGARRDFLGPGDSLVSANGVYRLTYRPNGDLVLGKGAGGTSVSKTAGQPAWRCIMQEDGNFVVYSSPYVAVFASDTQGNPGSRFVLSNDGQLGIFGPSGNRLNAPKLTVT